MSANFPLAKASHMAKPKVEEWKSILFLPWESGRNVYA